MLAPIKFHSLIKKIFKVIFTAKVMAIFIVLTVCLLDAFKR
mgnify:CR=1 FL=1